MQNLFWLFPVIFMLHEMEEIIGFRLWFAKNLPLVKRYPLLNKLYRGFSNEGFALAVLEEYLLCILATAISIIWQYYLLWIGFFIAFTLHLVIHLLQSLVIRKYIPAVISSIILLPPSTILISKVIVYYNYSMTEVVIASLASVVFMVVNLLFAHWLMRKVTQSISK